MDPMSTLSSAFSVFLGFRVQGLEISFLVLYSSSSMHRGSLGVSGTGSEPGVPVVDPFLGPILD